MSFHSFCQSIWLLIFPYVPSFMLPTRIPPFPDSLSLAGSACSLALCFPLSSVDLIQLYLIKSFPLIINLGLLSEQIYFISPSAAPHLSKISLEIRLERMLITNTKVAREASRLPTFLSASIKVAAVVRGAANRPPPPWL